METVKREKVKNLQLRYGINQSLGERDLDSWILSILQLRSHEKLLDVGCGDGRQILLYGSILREPHQITGVDVSKEMIETARQRARERGIQANFIVGTMENLIEYVAEGAYDVVTSSYAMYYSTDPNQALNQMARALKTDGRLLVLGPYKRNNEEIFRLLRKIKARIPDKDIYSGEDFNEDVVIPFFQRKFKIISLNPFTNMVHYQTRNDLINYYKAQTFYDEEALDRFAQEAEKIFLEKGEFLLTKRALGVLGEGKLE